MSEINANIVISPIDLGVTVNTNQLTFTPDAVSLNIYAGGVGSSNSLNANIANVHIYGGTNGYVLQTDGTGNLAWTAQTGNGGGNGTPGGSNTQVQYNDAGSFGGNVGFTFNEITGFLNVPGNVTAPYFVGNATFALLAGNATVASTANIANTANSVAGANVSGQVSNALIAGTVYTNAQPNITSVGTLTSLDVTGNISSGNANLGNLVISNFFSGNGSLLTGINGANISNIAYANYANFAGNVVNATQSNITSVGTLTNLYLNNTDIHLGANSSGNTGYAFVAIGYRANTGTNGSYAIAIGANTDANFSGAMAIGYQASAAAANAVAVGSYSYAQYANSVAIGYTAYARGTEAISIGYRAGFAGGSNLSRRIRIGPYAGNASPSTGGIAIGAFAGDVSQGDDAIAIGLNAGGTGQKERSVAIGYLAGYSNQGNNSIAIGFAAGNSSQHNNSIILNATTSEFNTSAADAFFVKPLRNVSSGNLVFYDATTGEVSYGSNINSGGNAAGSAGQIQFNAANVLAASANLTYDSSANMLTTDLLKTTNRTYASLPAASSVPYARSFITDATSATFNATTIGGGSNIVPVFSNGSVWKVG